MINTITEKEFMEEKEAEWLTHPRWKDIRRTYSPEQVWKLKGSITLEHTLAKITSTKLFDYLETEKYVNALGAVTSNQAIQMVQAGLKSIYVSGWQIAADMNEAGEMYLDQSLYPANSAPKLVQRINNAFMRADQIDHLNKSKDIDWFQPIVADGEAGFGGPLNVFEFTKAMIRAGAGGIHFEDQLSTHKKCGHLGGKVLTPTSKFIQTLSAARLAADVYDVPTILIARTDANSAKLIVSDEDPEDHDFIEGERNSDGFFKYNGGLDASISRGLSFSPYADLVWFETSKPDLEEARIFADAIHKKYPDQKFAYNCSPSFNWSKYMDKEKAATFQEKLSEMGYKFQFVTLAGFHQLNSGMFELASKYKKEGMAAYIDLQNTEFGQATSGYKAIKHQSFVGTTYFDEVALTISEGNISTLAIKESTEAEQFK